ncbi:MAG: hypothetical protein ACRENP_17365 [Longimicrobiales bacterium]
MPGCWTTGPKSDLGLTRMSRLAILAPVMGENEKARAEARMDAALAASGLQDPRPAFRERLRYFREEQPAVFGEALEYFEKTLVPRVAAEDAAPLHAWFEYGQRLSELTGPGRTMAIDVTGRARPHTGQPPLDRLILHVPHDPAVPVLPLIVPRELSEPQKATLDLLVHRARGSL